MEKNNFNNLNNLINKDLIEKNKGLIEEIINNIDNSKDLFNMDNFIDVKIKNFCDFILNKEIEDLKKNINSLKFIYGIGGLKLFVDNCLIPIKDNLNNLNSENEEEILKLICPKDKIKEVIVLFTEEEKLKISKFMNFLIDSVDLL